MSNLTVLERYIAEAVQFSSVIYRIDVYRKGNGYTGLHDEAGELFHAALGISTEAGELLDAWKKIIAYGRSPDYVNMDEEIGDLLWYVALYCDARAQMMRVHQEVTKKEYDAADHMNKIMQRNIAKLSARYPEKFTPYHAENRDLDKERRILEGGT